MFGHLKYFPAINLGFKTLKCWIDDNFRDKVAPVPGSVLYSDLYVAAEHSGIYTGQNKISNIVVDSLLQAESTVRLSSPEAFTQGGILHDRIYVSCNDQGAVGDDAVSHYAGMHVGQKSFYGLIFSNCHVFSEKCVCQAGRKEETFDLINAVLPDDTWERTIRSLKSEAKKRLGATKWRLWDWKTRGNTKVEEPDIDTLIEAVNNMVLDDKSIGEIKQTLSVLREYLKEVSDESIPEAALQKLTTYQKSLRKVEELYEDNKTFIDAMGHGFTANELKAVGSDDLPKIAEMMQSNQKIQKLVEKLGRSYVSEKKKKTLVKRVPNEVHGIHKSNELTRVLPSELSAFENEDMEYLFFAKYLESSLLTYQLEGSEVDLENLKTKGPIIACLDTSGSMQGMPLIKAKALLFTVSKILKKEKRELYVLLFGADKQIEELHVACGENSRNLLLFLSKGFDGGTDFETPLKRSVEIIRGTMPFDNADILMITDGLCSISDDFQAWLTTEQNELGFEIYTVICGDTIVADNYSSDIINL